MVAMDQHSRTDCFCGLQVMVVMLSRIGVKTACFWEESMRRSRRKRWRKGKLTRMVKLVADFYCGCLEMWFSKGQIKDINLFYTLSLGSKTG